MEAKTTKTAKGNLPRKESDLNTVASEVAASWEKRPQITLIWTTAAELKESAISFGSSYSGRLDVKGSRRSVTQSLKVMNAEIDHSVEHIKYYLSDIYSKTDAPAHYASFGIVKTSNKYNLPTDNDSRLYAIEQLLKGLEQHQLTDRKYGKAYWSEIYRRFVEIKQQASEADKVSTEHVSIKTRQKVQIRKTLNALVKTIQANYPDTWKEELRMWGFQKEKY